MRGQKITEANDFLRRSPGEVAVAITSKDKEIARLEQTQCPPGAPKK